jgi:2-iminoacetate synthase ThiH
MYKKLSDEEFKVYFSREISLYVSQGCKFTCDFCAAEKNQKEKYREAETIEKDLFYIMARLQDL